MTFEKGDTVFYVLHLKGGFPKVIRYTFEELSVSRNGYAWMKEGQENVLNPMKNLYADEMIAVEECIRRLNVHIEKLIMNKIHHIAKLRHFRDDLHGIELAKEIGCYMCGSPDYETEYHDGYEYRNCNQCAANFKGRKVKP